MFLSTRALLAMVVGTVTFIGLPAAFADPFELLVTETQQGPVSTNPATWGGVHVFTFTGNGSAATAGLLVRRRK